MTRYNIEIRRKGVNTGRFIEWNDPKGFYGALPFPSLGFTKDEALNIIEDLKRKYVYSVRLIGDDGSEEIISCLKSHCIIPMVAEEVETPKEPETISGMVFCFG